MKRSFKCLVLPCAITDFFVSSNTICQQEHGVVGRSISIHRDHIICIFHIFAECSLKRFPGNLGIRCNECKHGAHIRMDHTGSFCHSSDSHCHITDFDCNCYFFFLCVCRHDCLSRLCTALKIRFLRLCQFTDSIFHPFHGKLHSDHACGAD